VGIGGVRGAAGVRGDVRAHPSQPHFQTTPRVSRFIFPLDRPRRFFWVKISLFPYYLSRIKILIKHFTAKKLGRTCKISGRVNSAFFKLSKFVFLEIPYIYLLRKPIICIRIIKILNLNN